VAIGWKVLCRYIGILGLLTAMSAAAPDSRADASTYESADVQMTVTSGTVLRE